MLKLNTTHCGDCQTAIQDIDSDSVDCIVTDPPYGLSFMGKDWDKAVPSIAIWQECLRVLKPGAFAFVMCIPRQDCLARMICRLEDAGFNVAFSSIYHTFASGFPKAQNLGKVMDKKLGVKPIGKKDFSRFSEINGWNGIKNWYEYPTRQTPQAKALDGAYAGFQPKPAVEVIIVAMKPLEEKTYIDQAISNGHGCTWLDDCRIPFTSKNDATKSDRPNCSNKQYSVTCFQEGKSIRLHNNKGRFPANVLCEDDVLDDGHTRKTGNVKPHSQTPSLFCSCKCTSNHTGDDGSFSRYFSLDAWFAERIKQLPQEAQKTFPWLLVPKASKSEKNRGLEDIYTLKEGTSLETIEEIKKYLSQ